MPKGKRESNRPSAGGIVRNNYHRRNRKENLGHRWIGGYSGNKGVAEFERLSVETIMVPKLDDDDLRDRALIYWQKRKHDAEFIAATSIERMCVEYLRHRLSRYDSLRVRARGKAYLSLFRKLCDAISEMYPWLTEECNKQYRRRANAAANEHVRLVKRPDSLTSRQVVQMNAQESAAFTDSQERDRYEQPGYVGEVDISEDAKDPRSSTLNPENFMYLPPFLKPDKVEARRFAGAESSDRWWEWEEHHSRPQRDINGNPL